MKKLNIGIIGLGRIGKMHLENLVKLPEYFQVVSISDPARTDLATIAGHYQVPDYYHDYHQLLEDSAVDCVLIASATSTHARANRQGCSISQ